VKEKSYGKRKELIKKKIKFKKKQKRRYIKERKRKIKLKREKKENKAIKEKGKHKHLLQNASGREKQEATRSYDLSTEL
jgi:hypothetical protein